MTKPPDDLLKIFWVEASEYLESLNRLVLALEVATPEDDTTAELREVTRIAHSLKGAARTVGQTQIESLAHRMEDVFERALNQHLALSPTVCDALYDALDLIQMISSSGEVPAESLQATLDMLQALLEETGQPAPPPAPAFPPPAPDDSPETKATVSLPRLVEDTVRIDLDKVDQLMGQTSELLLARMHSQQRRRDLQAMMQEYRRWRRTWRQTRTAYIRTLRRMRDLETETAQTTPIGEGTADLQQLLEFLEITQQYMSRTHHQLMALNRALAQDNLHLTTLVDTLQADIASLRMLPFETILSGFQRLVRDLARETGKSATLTVHGGEVELDKHVLEMLKDPLMHILRNAVDHGIEPPEVREAAGKPPTGRITLAINARSNDIEVIVADDGAGIDPQIVRQRALDAGLIHEVDIDLLSSDAITALIFEPGFSTARQVTSVSGRGVGLDVVRQRIESLRGRLWVENRTGEGTAFHLVVPVSLSRIRCLLARVGQEQYAIPLTTVTRIINITPEEVFQVESRPMIRVDNRPMPLVHLGSVLERPDHTPTLSAETPVVILHSTEQRHVAFIIDELISEEELVLKKLGDELVRVRNVAGAAILGSGDVVIVLQTSDLIKSARRARTALETSTAGQAAETAREPSRVLVVDDSLTARTLEKNILEAAGYEVFTATNGQEALEKLHEHPVDVIVSDVEMPHMNGFELTRRIKSDPNWRQIPVILVTSLASAGDRERGLQAGADAYLVKSRFDQDELLQVIGQWV
ncbi:MAG: hybrid sensor histidine kinase/response regulator [Anaerolineae bacterium]